MCEARDFVLFAALYVTLYLLKKLGVNPWKPPVYRPAH